MNKRIKKKQEKRKSKIPKHIIRLANRWTDMDTNIICDMMWFREEELEYPQKVIMKAKRKHKRIAVFLSSLTGECMYVNKFSIYRSAYGYYR